MSAPAPTPDGVLVGPAKLNGSFFLKGYSMGWIKMDERIYQNYKTLKLAETCNIDSWQAGDYMCRFFIWARGHCETGKVEYNADQIALCIHLPFEIAKGFWDVEIIKDGWIDEWPEWGGAMVMENARKHPLKYKGFLEHYLGLSGMIQDDPGQSSLEKKREEKRRKEKKDQNPAANAALPSGFSDFWSWYPRKQGKGAVLKIWERLRPNAELLEKMRVAIEAQRRTEGWQKERGQFIPMPATWLNQQRWEDEVKVSAPPPRKPMKEFHLPEIPEDQQPKEGLLESFNKSRTEFLKS
jgi:hypothetical protein